MKPRFPVAALLVVALIGSSLAQTSVDDQDDKKRKLIEQKIKLVDMLINSPAAKKAPQGRDADSTALVEKGRNAIEAAKTALAERRFDEATRLVDEALKSASAASRRLAADGAGLSESAQRKSLADLAEQVATYRASVLELTRDGKVGNEAKALLGRIDALSAEARQLADGGRLGDANKQLAAAYRLAVEEISRLRAGHEVVMSLKFDTPADEFAYEQKRFNSNVIMVDMMIGEGRADGERRKLVDGFVGEGNKLKGLAEVEAKSGHYKEAVTLMEKATTQLNRALQSMGVPVF